jgi:aryl-alcohol dehydrogenase-like predicted oxidoreductase
MASPSIPPAAAAGSWRLGDRRVNRIGFGTMRLPQHGRAFDPAARPRDRSEAIAVLRRAVELGVNHIDTAAFYFSARLSVNELVNSALSPYPDELVVATKVGPGRSPDGEWLPMATPEQLRGQVEENLRQLGRDHLDLVNLRVAGRRSIAAHFAELARLREAGLIRHLGLSNVDEQQLAEARRIAPVVCVQNSYGLAHRPGQDALVDACGRAGIAFVPFFAIAGAGREGGLSTGGGPGDGPTAEIEAVAAAHGASLAQVRLAWALARGPHVLVIPGTGDPAHLVENVGAAALRLTAAEQQRLDELHRSAASRRTG